jgi:hypothetical protein
LFPALSLARSARCPIFGAISGRKTDLILIFLLKANGYSKEAPGSSLAWVFDDLVAQALQ